MPDWCFLSYAHDDAVEENYIKDFADALRKELRGLLPAGTDLIFFDEASIKTGQIWDARIQQAVGNSRTMVCLTSPSYVASEYCAKEFDGFQLRVSGYAASRGLPQPPELLLPILWFPPNDTYPERLTRIQYADADLPNAYK